MKLSKLINRSELARLMWPDDLHSKSRLDKKLKGINGQRVTEKDAEKIREILRKEIFENKF